MVLALLDTNKTRTRKVSNTDHRDKELSKSTMKENGVDGTGHVVRPLAGALGLYRRGTTAENVCSRETLCTLCSSSHIKGDLPTLLLVEYS